MLDSGNLLSGTEQLQREIWEDEGVIVSRSLDMFISKLRKKQEPDPDINIFVVRGKGYELGISSSEESSSPKLISFSTGE